MEFRWLYLGVEVVALLALLWFRYWRRFPLFTAYFVALSIQAISPHWHSLAWIMGPWLLSEPVLLALLAASCAEEFSRLVKTRRRRVAFGLCCFFALAVIIVWDLKTGDALQTFVQLRAYCFIGLSAFLVAAMGFAWRESVAAERVAWRHGALLLALVANHVWPNVLPRVEGTWNARTRVYNSVVMLCFALWAVLAWRFANRPASESSPRVPR